MFIRRSEYDALKNEIAHLKEAKARAEVTSDFLRVRVNQLEMDNGRLRALLTGEKQTVPQVERVEDPNEVSHPNTALDYEDMGDDLARKLGVDWDADGRVKYRH